MAEVVVKGSNNVLKGKVIGTEGSYANDPERAKDAVYDNDPLTFFDSPIPSDSWAGLDLGSKVKIDEINYLFRNDDNNIRIGDTYELVYWDNKWTSLKKVTATSSVLVFENCPDNALFLLRNHTRGTEERIFMYKNDEQIWF